MVRIPNFLRTSEGKAYKSDFLQTPPYSPIHPSWSWEGLREERGLGKGDQGRVGGSSGMMDSLQSCHSNSVPPGLQNGQM